MNRTFLQLMGKSLTPTDGLVYLPENLNCIYIPGEPLLLNTSLIENLRFGNIVDHPEAEVWELCKLVGVGEELLYKPDLQVGVNGSKLSVSNKTYICLARALLSSADILLMSNTLDILSPADGRYFLQIMRDWIKDRGVPCLSSDNPAGQDTGDNHTLNHVIDCSVQ